MNLTLEKFIDGSWRRAATLTIEEPDFGLASPCTVEYMPEYARAYLNATGEPALSVHLPVSFHPSRQAHWAPFLLDILPSGFGRNLLVARERWLQPDGAHNDAGVLAYGGGHPGGNVRVAEAHAWLQMQLPPAVGGWSLCEMQRNSDDLLRVVHEQGVQVAGTCNQGQAAKLWLTHHLDGFYYADAVVPDSEAQAHYLVKMPRNDRDAILLQHEYHWLRLAKSAGLAVHGEPFRAGKLLFIPRFDRVLRDGRVQRRAVESAFSLLGVAKYAQPLCHEDILAAWVARADMTVLGVGLLEYLQRDILCYCLRVDDNHGRNTAFFLTGNGLRLTPLFDFSPMFLADDPPVRSTLWRHFRAGTHTEWARLFDDWLPSLIGPENSEGLRQALAAWRPQLEDTYRQFLPLERDPRTDRCEQRFETALEVLDALR